MIEALIGEQWLADPRLRQARELLHESLADYQRRIDGVRPPLRGTRADYLKAIEKFGEMRGGKLFFDYLGSGLGHGPLVELGDGSVKYDMITGIGVHGLGHGHPALLDASFDAAIRDTVMQGNLQQNRESVALTKLLLDTVNQGGANFAHCFLTTSGAMANENALKMIFQKHNPAARLIAFERCFSGRTTTLSQITDKPAYREGLPSTIDVDYVPFFDADHPAQSTRRAVDVLQNHLARHRQQHAAMCFELVLGEGGYYPGDHDFFAALMRQCRQHGLAVFIDEVQTFGRTTQPLAFQHFGLDEFVDVVTVGKITQVCATLFKDSYCPQPGLVSQTFTGATSSIFAATAVLRELIDGDYFGADGRIAAIHRRFVGHLASIAQRHPERVAGPFGIGGMIAFTPFGGAAKKANLLVHALFDAGVIAFITGGSPTRLRLLPPIAAISDEQIDRVMAIMERVVVELDIEERQS